MKRTVFVGISASMLCVFSGVAQDLPQCYYWQNHPLNAGGQPENPDPKFAPMIHVALGGSITTPQQAAIAVRDLINQARAASPTWALLDGSNICILLRNFGEGPAQTASTLPNIDYGFFRPGLDELSGLITTDWPNLTGREARAWRHPFLTNATTSDNAKLRA